jgi:hypothetical protein
MGRFLTVNFSLDGSTELAICHRDSFIDGSLRDNLVWDSDRNITDIEIENVLKQVNALAGSSFQRTRLSIIHFTFLAANDND